MSEQMTQRIERRATVAVPVMVALGEMLMLVILAGHADILAGALTCKDAHGKSGACDAGTLGNVVTAVNDVKGPATALIGSFAGLGVVGGGALFAVSHPSGTKMMTASAAAGLVVLLGNGVVS
jgi:hypothetical protein